MFDKNSLKSSHFIHINQEFKNTGMSKTKEMQIKEIDSQISSLNGEILPRIAEAYKQIKEFHLAEVKGNLYA